MTPDKHKERFEGNIRRFVPHIIYRTSRYMMFSYRLTRLEYGFAFYGDGPIIHEGSSS